METPAIAPTPSKTAPKDFFLWLGAVISLYGSIASFITLLFEYIQYAFPDQLAGYTDPYGGAVRFAMAALIVLVPTLVTLFYVIRRSIAQEAGKAHIWVRRWAIVLTLFIAAITILIDLITLINTFLGGEITIRFGLKVLVVLLVAIGVFVHFLADQRGYWLTHTKKAYLVGMAVLALTAVAIVSGFFIIGTPQQVRAQKYDAQRVNDLQSIQSQVLAYWQQKRELPYSLSVLNDDFSGYREPFDPETGSEYEYTIDGSKSVSAEDGKVSFALCATFSTTGGQAAATTLVRSIGDSWSHYPGKNCFGRTIDPTLYPAVQDPKIR